MNKVLFALVFLSFHLHSTASRVLPGTINRDLNDTSGEIHGLDDLDMLAAAAVVPRYQLYMMAYQWPKGYCNLNKKCQAAPLPDVFTAHGLWPTNVSSVLLLSQCNGGIWSDITDQGLLNQLNKDWPDLQSPTVKPGSPPISQSFWEHEWKAHGKCSIYDQKGYILQTLKLYGQLNIKEKLATVHKISPGPNPITFTVLENAIKSMTGKTPDLSCSQTCDLLEVRICYDTALKNMDCPQQQADPNPPKNKKKKANPVKGRSSSCLACSGGIIYRS